MATGRVSWDRCGHWKWPPISENDAPIVCTVLVSSSDVVASPETFVDGLKSFRHVLFRRHLGETLVGVSPRNWDLMEVTITQVAGS